ncbi:MAG: hypothetical protein HKN27_05795 [Silicimonas sp.]|nr:hypothetical protein [Silicimonas sp.]
MALGIPKTLGHIWIGHLPPPQAWMQSWKDHHPDWNYVLYDNEALFSRRWRHQALITEYYRRGEYAGVSDLMRYQILHEMGGFLPEADSICLRPTDELWSEPALYSVYENEEKKPGLISPFLAATPNHPYLHYINMRIQRRVKIETLQAAWRSVGNQFLKKAMAAKPAEGVVIFPSHTFIPQHKSGPRYAGNDPVYCDQLWGTTHDIYEDAPQSTEIDALRAQHIARLEAKR